MEATEQHRMQRELGFGGIGDRIEGIRACLEAGEKLCIMLLLLNHSELNLPAPRQEWERRGSRTSDQIVDYFIYIYIIVYYCICVCIYIYFLAFDTHLSNAPTRLRSSPASPT